MDELMQMGKDAGLKKLAEHERAGTLREYISHIAPEYIDCGEVMKFTLIDDLGWW